MALRALKIVKEEIARAIAVTRPDKRVLLETVGEVIEERIQKECIDQHDPSDLNYSAIGSELIPDELFAIKRSGPSCLDGLLRDFRPVCPDCLDGECQVHYIGSEPC